MHHLKHKKVVLSPRQPWFSDNIHQSKCFRRKAERKWLRSGSPVDRDRFKQAKITTIDNCTNLNVISSMMLISCGNNNKSFSVLLMTLFITRHHQSFLIMIVMANWRPVSHHSSRQKLHLLEIVSLLSYALSKPTRVLCKLTLGYLCHGF